MVAVPMPDMGGGRWGRGRLKSVVVADTERHIVRLIQVNLERQGIVVYPTDSVEAASTAIAAYKPDGMIMSSCVDGWLTLIDTLLADDQTRDMIIMALTHSESEDDLARRHQVDLVLRKPFNPHDLARYVSGQ